jgi:phosphoglucosamine mutase
LVNVTGADKLRRTSWAQCQPLQEAVLAAEAAMAGSGRVLVRASGTEPLLRVMVEAAHQEDVDHWCAHLAALSDRHLNAD